MLVASRIFAVHKAEASGFCLMKEWIVMMTIVLRMNDMFGV